MACKTLHHPEYRPKIGRTELSREATQRAESAPAFLSDDSSQRHGQDLDRDPKLVNIEGEICGKKCVMKAPTAGSNVPHDTREGWLRSAADKLRPYFSDVGYPLPSQIRFAIAFPSTGRKGKRMGECWHSGSSEDGNYEIFLRADLAEPLEVLGVLVKELVHTALPNDAGHGKLFKAAALKVGLQGPMRSASPGVLLQQRLTEITATLGPLPHARLNIADSPLVAVAPAPAMATALDRPKKQRTRHLKAECITEGCGYLVRVSGKQVREIGPPWCPKHGAMSVDLPPDDEAEEAESVHTPLAASK